MSFILDALKKSEIERQRQTIPGLVDSGTVRPRAKLPGWAIALCVLLAVNLIVLLVVLVRGWVTSTPAQPTAQAGLGYSGAGHAAADEPGADSFDLAAVRIEHAVIYDPMRQEIFTATRGSGAGPPSDGPAECRAGDPGAGRARAASRPIAIEWSRKYGCACGPSSRSGAHGRGLQGQ